MNRAEVTLVRETRQVNLLREHENVVHRIQRLVDVGWIIVAHVLVVAAYGVRWEPRSSNATLSAVIVFSVAAELCSIYRGWRVDRFSVELRMTTLAWLMTVAALMTFAFAMKTSAEYSRVATFGWFVLAPALLCGWRVVVRLTLRVMRANGRNVRNVVIFRATTNARDLCKEILTPSLVRGVRVAGVYDDRGPDRREDLTDVSCPYTGSSTELVNACRENKIDAVYISLPLRAEPRIGKLLQELSNTTATVHLVMTSTHFNLISAHWSAIGEVALISAHDTPFRGVDQLLKRLEDIVVASLIVLIIAAPMFVISVIIKLTSPGPIFFRQRRYGLNGEEIRILKFRSMTVSEDGPQIAQATRNDARVTKFGRFLRRSSLDRLPPVHRKSLPEKCPSWGRVLHAAPAHSEAYRSLIQGYMLRHKVKPGITG